MLPQPKCPVIALEEHYWDPELTAHFTDDDAPRGAPTDRWLYDLTDVRLKQMDEAGIEIQVLSHSAPSGQRLPADSGPALIRRVNDRLAEHVAAEPRRFAGFAALATADPRGAADELERAVVKLGLKGAMLHGLTNGEFLDLPKYWPIYERAEALDVPIYFHPAIPDKRVSDVYYRDYAEDFPLFARPAWGYTVEAATQAIRLVLSGLFEKHPKFKVLLGHFGETLPFLTWRVDSALRRPGGKKLDFRGIFVRNFWVTTSGFFSDQALQCAMMEMGSEHILFAVDWPFVGDNKPAVDWLSRAPISNEDKIKIASGNAQRLLRI